MSQQCVVAVCQTFDNARSAVQALEEADFPSDQVSFVTHSVENEVPQEKELDYGDKTEVNAAKGAGVGGLIGMLLGAPLVTVTGLGAVLIAGPIAMGLAGALVGGFLGAMSGWGVDPDRVKHYEKQVADGAFLIVFNGSPKQVAEAEQLLQDSEADEVDLHAKTSADAVEGVE
jgi:hypothetical protein